MSKTNQRRISLQAEKKQMYRSGYRDGLEGKMFLWRRHPLLKQYTDGYEAGRAKLNGIKSTIRN